MPLTPKQAADVMSTAPKIPRYGPPVGSRMITEADVDAALSFLRDNAIELGRAKERAKKAERMLGHIEAILFKEAEGSGEARRMAAKGSDRYLEAINEDAAAAGAFQQMLALREAAALTLEIYRTQESSARAFKL